ncbi:helix-turn-helix domain-containing protein [Gordonia sp. 852002-50395_SCH5434458]
MDSTGASRAKIAEAVGRSKSTVSGWINRAAEVVGSPREMAKS